MCTPFQILKVFSFLAPTPNSLDTVRKNRLSYNLFVNKDYRAYAADNVVEIIEDPKCDFPTAKSNKSEVGGLFVLQTTQSADFYHLRFLIPNRKIQI
jgi:hypothetical protein